MTNFRIFKVSIGQYWMIVLTNPSSDDEEGFSFRKPLMCSAWADGKLHAIAAEVDR